MYTMNKWYSTLVHEVTVLSGIWVAYDYFMSDSDWWYYFQPVGLYCAWSAIQYYCYEGLSAGAATINLVEGKLGWGQWFWKGAKQFILLKSNAACMDIHYEYTPTKSWWRGVNNVEDIKGEMSIDGVNYDIKSKVEKRSGWRTGDLWTVGGATGKDILQTSFEVTQNGRTKITGRLHKAPGRMQNDFTFDITTANINITGLENSKKLYVRKRPAHKGWYITVDDKRWFAYKNIATIFPDTTGGLTIQYSERLCKQQSDKLPWTPNNDTCALVSLASLMLKYKLRMMH